MQTLISTKHQVVIPKEARKKLGLKPGQKMEVEVTNHTLILSKAKKRWEWPDDYYKRLKNPWEGVDVEKYLEDERNSWG